MDEKEVLLLLTDQWADWEASYAIAEINSTLKYSVKTIAVNTQSKVSIGGVRAEIDYRIADYKNFDNLAMIILPGGFSWAENQYDEIILFLKRAREFQVPIAAICGATIFLGKHGFFDNIKHTGDDVSCFIAEEKYKARKHYVSAQVVVDKGFITANETAAVEFAYEILKC